MGGYIATINFFSILIENSKIHWQFRANSLSINIFQGLKFTGILIVDDFRCVDPPLVLVLCVRVHVLAAGEAAAEVGEAPGGGGQTGDRDLAAEQPAQQPPRPGHHPRLAEGLE